MHSLMPSDGVGLVQSLHWLLASLAGAIFSDTPMFFSPIILTWLAFICGASLPSHLCLVQWSLLTCLLTAPCGPAKARV
jgi:hypothetical protein